MHIVRAFLFQNSLGFFWVEASTADWSLPWPNAIFGIHEVHPGTCRIQVCIDIFFSHAFLAFFVFLNNSFKTITFHKTKNIFFHIPLVFFEKDPNRNFPQRFQSTHFSFPSAWNFPSGWSDSEVLRQVCGGWTPRANTNNRPHRIKIWEEVPNDWYILGCPPSQ